MTRDEAIKWLERIEERYINGGDEAYDAARKEALHMAIESLERKGEWIYHTEPLAFRPYGHYTCNLCNEISWDKSNFCPNCGADMRGGNNDIH